MSHARGRAAFPAAPTGSPREPAPARPQCWPPCRPRREKRPAPAAAQGPGGQDPAQTCPSEQSPSRAGRRRRQGWGQGRGRTGTLTTHEHGTARPLSPPRAGGTASPSNTHPQEELRRTLVRTSAENGPRGRCPDDLTWLAAGRPPSPRKPGIPCGLGSPGAPGTSVPEPQRRRSQHVTACAAATRPPQGPELPGSAVPLRSGQDDMRPHAGLAGSSNWTLVQGRGRVHARLGQRTLAGRTRAQAHTSPPDNHTCAHSRVHTHARSRSALAHGRTERWGPAGGLPDAGRDDGGPKPGAGKSGRSPARTPVNPLGPLCSRWPWNVHCSLTSDGLNNVTRGGTSGLPWCHSFTSSKQGPSWDHGASARPATGRQTTEGGSCPTHTPAQRATPSFTVGLESASGKPASLRAASPVAADASAGTPRHPPHASPSPPAPCQTRTPQLTSRTWTGAWTTAWLLCQPRRRTRRTPGLHTLVLPEMVTRGITTLRSGPKPLDSEAPEGRRGHRADAQSWASALARPLLCHQRHSRAARATHPWPQE